MATFRTDRQLDGGPKRVGVGAVGQRNRGALNLYARYPSAFGVIDRGKGLVLAILAGVPLSAAESRHEEERQIITLRAP
jgi:hypothetical protein